MPYIPTRDRARYDRSIRSINDALADVDWEPGHVNYIFTKILHRWFSARNRYRTICMIMGTLLCVGLEFYRKRATVYEDEKEVENGSV